MSACTRTTTCPIQTPKAGIRSEPEAKRAGSTKVTTKVITASTTSTKDSPTNNLTVESRSLRATLRTTTSTTKPLMEPNSTWQIHSTESRTRLSPIARSSFSSEASLQASPRVVYDDPESFKAFFESYGPMSECRMVIDKVTRKTSLSRPTKRVWFRHVCQPRRHHEDPQQKSFHERKRGSTSFTLDRVQRCHIEERLQCESLRRENQKGVRRRFAIRRNGRYVRLLTQSK